MVQKITEYKEIPTRTEKIDKYICEVCKTEYGANNRAKECEKRHTCTHPGISYDFSEPSVGNGFGPKLAIGIKAYCSNCNKNFGGFNFENLEGEPELLKSLW